MRNKFLGGLVGLAAGDALGTTVEFSQRGTFEPLTDIVGGGPFSLSVGQWTDDTSMALCLAQSLIDKCGFDAKDQLAKYLDWYLNGYMSSTGKCFDIGSTTVNSLREFWIKGTIKRPDAYDEAGNGSLMRLAPVALFYSSDVEEAVVQSGLSSTTTHGAQEAYDACRFFGFLISTCITNPTFSKEELLGIYTTETWNKTFFPLSEKINNIALRQYYNKEQDKIFSSGYVVHSLEAALWSFYTTSSFEEGALRVANLGDDADTVAAIYGQIAGVFYGYEGIPEKWRNKLHNITLIESLANQLYDLKWQQ